jgi:hypothetical protein
MKLKKRHKRWLALGGGLIVIVGIIIGIVQLTKDKDDDSNKKEGVIISAGDDGKNNGADFNGQEYTEAEKPEATEAVVQDNPNDLNESANSIVGEWTTYGGDTLICRESDGKYSGSLYLENTGATYDGTIETDNKTYITVKSDSGTTNFEILDFSEADLDGVTGIGLISLVLKDKDTGNEYLFVPMTVDKVSDEVAEIVKENPDGVTEEKLDITVGEDGDISVDGEYGDIIKEYIEVVTENETEATTAE